MCIRSCQFFHDLIDLPFFAVGFVVGISVWRGVQLFRDVKRAERRSEARHITAVTFVRWLLDFPCAVCAILVLCTFWRARAMLRVTRTHALMFDCVSRMFCSALPSRD